MTLMDRLQKHKLGVSRRLAHQDVDSLVGGAFGDNVLDPSLVHVHGAAVLENGSSCMEVLRAVHSVGTVEKEVACLVGNSCREGMRSTEES